tara:strand:+ start:84 stop:947 length:864 start_codon:yes stop_codon:yes gene_type:complete
MNEKINNIDKVDIILSVELSTTSDIIFTYDLNGQKFGGISKALKVRALNNGCYLGRITLSSGKNKWVDIDKSEVDKNISNKEFLIKHLPTKKDFEKKKAKAKSKPTYSYDDDNYYEESFFTRFLNGDYNLYFAGFFFFLTLKLIKDPEIVTNFINSISNSSNVTQKIEKDYNIIDIKGSYKYYMQGTEDIQSEFIVTFKEKGRATIRWSIDGQTLISQFNYKQSKDDYNYKDGSYDYFYFSNFSKYDACSVFDCNGVWIPIKSRGKSYLKPLTTDERTSNERYLIKM